MRAEKIFLFVFVLVLTAGNVSQQQVLAVQRKAAVTDDKITDEVRIVLASDHIVKGGALQVNVRYGVVTLSGPVGTEKQKSRAEHLAKKVKGVKTVVNKIEIRTG